MSSANNIIIKSFPKDDKEYLVKRYELIRENPSVRASGFMVQVLLKDLASSGELRINILIGHCIIVKIGSVWKNQRLIKIFEPLQNTRLKLFNKRDFRLSMERDVEIEYLVEDPKTGHNKTIRKSEFNGETYRLLSVFTVFKIKNGISVAIPSLEIFIATYAVQTYSLLYELMGLPIDEVLHKHVLEYAIEEEKGNKVYFLETRDNHYMSTRIFLAYLACDTKTREHVSKIKSSLEKNKVVISNIAYSAMEVLPYHPEQYNIVASGYYDESKKRFWVHQINEYDMPGEAIYKGYEIEDKSDKKPAKGKSKSYANYEEITDDVGITDDEDAGWGAGAKYIISPVVMNKDQSKISSKPRKRKKDSSGKTIKKEEEIENVSASPISGQAGSDKTGTIRIEEKANNNLDTDREEALANIPLIKAIKEIKEEVCYLDNRCNRHNEISYCTLKNGKSYNTDRSRWAKSSGAKYRRLLVCEIAQTNSFVYFLDIERRKSDSYLAIMFRLSDGITLVQLDEIRGRISYNKGVFGGKDKKRKEFPIEKLVAFKHSGEADVMAERIEKLMNDYDDA